MIQWKFYQKNSKKHFKRIFRFFEKKKFENILNFIKIVIERKRIRKISLSFLIVIEIENKKISNWFFLRIFFFRDVFRLLFFSVYQSFCCFFVLDSKLIDKSNQSFFSKNFFFSLLIFFDLSFYSFSSFLIDQTILLIYHFKTAQKTDLKFKIFKSAFKNLIEIIIKLYSKSIDFALKLASSSKKKKKKKKKKKINQIENDAFFSEQWTIDEFLIIKSVN